MLSKQGTLGQASEVLSTVCSLHFSHSITIGRVIPFLQEMYGMGHSKGFSQEENGCVASSSCGGGGIIGVYSGGSWVGGCGVGGGCRGVGVGVSGSR